MIIKIRTQVYGWFEIDIPNELLVLLKIAAEKKQKEEPNT